MARQRKKIRRGKPRHTVSMASKTASPVQVYYEVKEANPNADRKWIFEETARISTLRHQAYLKSRRI